MEKHAPAFHHALNQQYAPDINVSSFQLEMFRFVAVMAETRHGSFFLISLVIYMIRKNSFFCPFFHKKEQLGATSNIFLDRFLVFFPRAFEQAGHTIS